MKSHSQLLTAIFAIFLSGVLFSQARAQANEPQYVFVIMETTVTRQNVETSDANPEERRFYVSNVVDIPSDDPALYRNAYKTADEYFTATIGEPLKAKGILHQYYDDNIRINDKVVYTLKTRAEVEQLREKTLGELKEQNANIFTFNWSYGTKTDGLAMSKPTLYYHEPGKPLYGVSETKPVPETPAKPPVVNKLPAKKHPRNH